MGGEGKMRYTIIFIFSWDMKKVLMMHKTKGPYPGRLNGVGGKIEDFDLSAEYGAYREVKEETGLLPEEMAPLFFLVQEIFPSGTELNIFYTKMDSSAKARQMEEEKLEWFNTLDLLDVRDLRLAGEGNIPFYLQYALILENAAYPANE